MIFSLQMLLALQCFNAAKYIIHNGELKSAKDDDASADNGQSHASIGLIIGTPCEILQYIEEGSVVPAEIRYLVSIRIYVKTQVTSSWKLLALITLVFVMCLM